MRVSVIIPTFNRFQFVCEAVESVLAQTYTDLEIIVVDDGSTDGTADLLAYRYSNRIRIERLPRNEGRSTARNVGWALARGEYVAFLDSDDLWEPEKLARQMPHFARPDVVLVHSWVGKISADGRPLEAETAVLNNAFAKAAHRGYSYGGITETWCRMYTSSVVMRQNLLRQTGGFDPRLSNWEDWDVLWRAARIGKVETVEENLVWHRSHSGNTPTRWKTDSVTWMAVIRRHLAELESLPHRGTLVRARRNLFVNMALGEYWRRGLPASRRWMWRALRADPSLFRNPAHPVWGSILLHACLPHRFANYFVERWGPDDYRTPESS